MPESCSHSPAATMAKPQGVEGYLKLELQGVALKPGVKLRR